MRSFFLTAALLLFLTTPSPGAPPPRPASGCGVMAINRPPTMERSTVVLYREPGVERLAEAPVAALPHLPGAAASPLVAVLDRKGEWVRVAYDEAGREGWTVQERSWEYRPWQEFLPGRRVSLLPGLKKGLYALAGEPREGGGEAGRIAAGRPVRVIRSQGDWVLLEAPPAWLRWRDSDGRLTVSLYDRE